MTNTAQLVTAHLVEGWEWAKDWLVPKNAGQRALLHIHLGMLIYLAGAAFAGRRMRSPWPLLALLGLECLNEAADLYRNWPDLARWRLRDTAGDFLNTMLWPTMLFLIANLAAGNGEEPGDSVEQPEEPQLSSVAAGVVGGEPPAGSS